MIQSSSNIWSWKKKSNQLTVKSMYFMITWIRNRMKLSRTRISWPWSRSLKRQLNTCGGSKFSWRGFLLVFMEFYWCSLIFIDIHWFLLIFIKWINHSTSSEERKIMSSLEKIKKVSNEKKKMVEQVFFHVYYIV